MIVWRAARVGARDVAFAQRPDRVPVLVDHIGEVGDLEQDRRRHRHRGRAEHDDPAEQELLVHPPRLRAHGTGG